MSDRVKKLQQILDRYNIEAMLISKPENRRYISGFTGSAGTLLIDKQNAYLFTDFRYVEQVKEQCPGFKVIQIGDDFYQKLLHLLQKSGVSRLGFETHYVTYESYDKMAGELSGVQLVPVKDIAEELRLIKNSEELQLIEKAVDITDRAYSEMLQLVKTGMTEKELALELEFIMRRLGAQGRAFDFIVASGPRGALPHGVASDRVIQPGDMVTIDCGAVYKGYHSDMTRNFVLGKADEKQQEIYNIVLEAQVAGIEAVRPGVPAASVDLAARGVIERYGYAQNFGHGTGHGVGLAIHEGPRISFQEQELILKPGMVLTVEPGIYLPGWGGVRIEDIVLVTENGCRILTKTPKNQLPVI
ncbi:Xaa-Pro aminopeptidase [Desulfohalotomaculum tongense]|uniref:M24 family metallopeptidase n=1 Tax=Desulforadius tongensis TaxID=1216062 RepID=UPI001959950E|nr:Xaa-Pro peptidase family protein [Desulforadius tongensis]MBM7855474.1 Xaa-Pro aminopeptidase [Desulforadius tongensis]